jgi:hypothetical protein
MILHIWNSFVIDVNNGFSIKTLSNSLEVWATNGDDWWYIL